MAPGEWGDFELELEWSISPCGNSGIFYRGSEALDAIWESAPEMQILDDTCHPDGRVPNRTAGAVYDLYTPTEAAARPAGAWNAVRVVARGPRVEHWLNGVRVVAYDQSTADWAARLGASKFRDMAAFGTLRRGVIALQDHGDAVRFRTIRIRPL